MEPQPSPVPEALQRATSRIEEALRPLLPDIAVESLHGYLSIMAPVGSLQVAARTLRDDLGYVYLSMVTAADYQDRIEVIYLVFSLENSHGVLLRTNLPRAELPECPSLTTVWPGAEFQEREVYDLMGVSFVGHPDLRRILTDDDFPGHPLRKDFSIEPDYVLMRHLRYGVEGQLKPREKEGSDTPELATPSPELEARNSGAS